MLLASGGDFLDPGRMMIAGFVFSTPTKGIANVSSMK